MVYVRNALKKSWESLTMTDKKTTRQWALNEGINPNRAQHVRQDLGIGEKLGAYWLLTQEEWKLIKANMPGRGNWKRNKGE